MKSTAQNARSVVEMKLDGIHAIQAQLATDLIKTKETVENACRSLHQIFSLPTNSLKRQSSQGYLQRDH